MESPARTRGCEKHHSRMSGEETLQSAATDWHREEVCSHRLVKCPHFLPVHASFGVAYRGSNVVIGEIRIRLTDAGEIVAIAKQIEDQRDRNPGPLDHWLTNQNLGVNNNAR